MKLKELKAGIIEIMKTKYPSTEYKYYSKMVIEGYDRPSFFLRLAQISNNRETINYRSKVYVLYITYLQTKRDEVDQLNKIDEIENLFGNYIKIGNRAVDVTGFDYDFLGSNHNILEITINIEWMDCTSNEEINQIMESAEINTELTEG